MTEFALVRAIDWILQLLSFAIIARALLSWIAPNTDNPIVRVLHEVTEPILAPLRRVIPLIGMIDITPIVALFLIQFLQNWLVQALLS
jgi:YggT family protein